MPSHNAYKESPFFKIIYGRVSAERGPFWPYSPSSTFAIPSKFSLTFFLQSHSLQNEDPKEGQPPRGRPSRGVRNRRPPLSRVLTPGLSSRPSLCGGRPPSGAGASQDPSVAVLAPDFKAVGQVEDEATSHSRVLLLFFFSAFFLSAASLLFSPFSQVHSSQGEQRQTAQRQQRSLPLAAAAAATSSSSAPLEARAARRPPLLLLLFGASRLLRPLFLSLP